MMTAGTGLIGPGRLILVVGPSGAGKDTLIAQARARLERDPTIMFPRRIVTRATSAAEDHHTISDRDFALAMEEGAYAFWWEAHGLKYAFPAGIDDDIRAGRTLVCNVSRGIAATLRRRYAHVAVVLITAPPEVLAARLAARGRASDGDIGQRIGRAAPPEAEISPDRVIENSGELEVAVAQFMAAIASAAHAAAPSRRP
jgi:ribose 1,5-bisphosphokinase